MRIDTHCHVFTFRSFLTAAAEVNLIARLKKRLHLSDAACNDILRLIKDDILDGDTHSRLVDFADRLRLIDASVQDFVCYGCQPSISDLTDMLYAKLSAMSGDNEFLMTALMLDVIDGESSSQDKDLFASQFDDPDFPAKPLAGQYHDTVLQAVRFPGRVLPFVAVNPLRGEQAFDIMHHALDSGECVGVKLYPSLGFDIRNPMIERIMNECAGYDAPIIMHCNDGGFCGAGDYDYNNCSPVSWRDVVTSHNVRIDFAHFGDQDDVRYGSPTLWRDAICKLMQDELLLAYADVSFQSGPLGSEEIQKAYIAWLKERLESDCGDNILFGTDSYILFTRSSAEDYWNFFQTELGVAFERIAVLNPMRFLGFDLTDASQIDTCLPLLDSSLERHGNYLKSMKGHPEFAKGHPVAPWLTRLWALRP